MDIEKKILLSEEENFYFSGDLSGKTYFGEEVFLENFANKDYSTTKLFFLLEVYEKKDKLGIRSVIYEKKRGIGKQYYKISKEVRFITYNLRTKNFYWGFKVGSKKRIRSKAIYCNSFYRSPYSIFYHSFISILKDASYKSLCPTNGFLPDNEKIDKFSKVFSFYLDKLQETFKSKFELSKIESIDGKLFTIFLLQNNIVIPDTVENFINQRIEKKELLKKGNLVSYFMNENKLFGKKIRRLLSTFDGTYFYELENLIYIFKVFDVDYFNKVDIKYIGTTKFPLSYKIPISGSGYSVWDNFNFDNNTKMKLLRLYNQGVNIHDLIEHINFINYLKQNGLNIGFDSKNPVQFNFEHEKISQIYDDLRTYRVFREYDQKFIKDIEKTFKTSGGDYYPIILKNSEDYIDESNVQRNCVRTYSTKPSLIISIRKGSNVSDERITLEYKIFDGTYKRVQTRGKFNDYIDDYDETLCGYLDKKINKFISRNDVRLPSLHLKNDYLEKMVDSEINLMTKSLVWKEDISIFDNNNIWRDQMELDLPF